MAGIWTRPDLLRRANAADIAAIMEIERQPGYERLVGRWTQERHQHNISRPGCLYLVHDDMNGSLDAFAALSGLGTSTGEVLLKRLMVRQPGKGTGTAFLRSVMLAVFEGAPTERLWLRVLPDNERALRLYHAQGFKDERVLEKAGTLPDGTHVDLLIMAIAYDDWAEKQN